MTHAVVACLLIAEDRFIKTVQLGECLGPVHFHSRNDNVLIASFGRLEGSIVFHQGVPELIQAIKQVSQGDVNTRQVLRIPNCLQKALRFLSKLLGPIELTERHQVFRLCYQRAAEFPVGASLSKQIARFLKKRLGFGAFSHIHEHIGLALMGKGSRQGCAKFRRKEEVGFS